MKFSDFSASLAILVIVLLFDESHASGCEQNLAVSNIFLKVSDDVLDSAQMFLRGFYVLSLASRSFSFLSFVLYHCYAFHGSKVNTSMRLFKQVTNHTNL